jgi:hypothetical protein
MDRANVGMIQPRSRLRLIQKALFSLFIASQLRRQELGRDEALEQSEREMLGKCCKII